MSYSATILAEPNLVNYWRLGDTSGTTAADSKGSTTLTYSGGFTLNQTTITHEGASVLLNGTTGKISQASSITASITNVTFECWFKLAATGVFHTLINNGTGAALYGLRVNNANKIEYLRSGSSNSTISPTLDTSVPHHIALILDGSSIASVYLDGILIHVNTSAPLTPTGFFGIGCNSGSSNNLNGRIQEAAYYNTALSASTIQTHYNAASTTEKARITQIGAVVLGTSNPPKARVSQIGAVVLGTGNPKARVSQHGVLTVSKGTPKARVSQHGVLTIIKLGAVSTQSAGAAALLPSL